MVTEVELKELATRFSTGPLGAVWGGVSLVWVCERVWGKTVGGKDVSGGRARVTRVKGEKLTVN